MADRMCEDCGSAIPPQKGSARPRKFCADCRPPRNRPNPRVIHLPEPGQSDEAPLVASYRAELESVERLDSPEGSHVMLLAGLLAAGSHTAAGAASLSRELRAAMDAALKGVAPQGDRLDELADRRAQKAAGA